MQQQDNSIKSGIRSFIIQKFPAAKKRSLSDELPLLESGIIDSMGILEVVTFLEQTFSIHLEDEELTPDNFANINCMASFVEEKLRQSRVPAV
jgi:acyl carrier protein